MTTFERTRRGLLKASALLPFAGSLGGTPPPRPIVSVAAVP